MPDLPPLWDDLTFLSPLSEDRAAGLVRFLVEDDPAQVLDIGCGWGELLLRVLEASPDADGVGVDLEEKRIAEASRRAQQRGLAGRMTAQVADARTLSGRHDAVVCIGASQVWGPPVEENQALDYCAALRALRTLLPRGGRLVYGEAIWSAAPTPEAIAPLAGRDDEYVTLPELVTLVKECGFAVVGLGEASREEWDAFESGFAARFARWQAAHPADHSDAGEVRTAAQQQHAAYLEGYRGVLGMAYLRLVAV